MRIDIVQEIHIGLLPYGCQNIIHPYRKIGPFDRYRAPAAGSIRFAQLHADAGHRFHLALRIPVDLLRKSQEHIFHAFEL